MNALEKNLRKLFAELQKEGVKTVTVSYGGYGDSGEIESTTVVPEVDFNDKKLSFLLTTQIYQNKKWFDKEETIELDLVNAIDHIAYEIQAAHNAGYENNEGGGGEITFNVESKVVQHEHYYNTVERVEDSTVINLAEELAES